MNRLLFLLAALAICCRAGAQTGHVELGKLGPDIQKVVRQAYQASVSIAVYDATKGASGDGIFSGVVVDTAGHVLSVAHAVKPGTLYQLTFPDGKKKLARGLGRIASNDAAMLKIIEKGTWPYAPMGWSASLRQYMPCVSISYPGTVAAKTPTIRFGYIAEPEARGAYLRTTCLMEPGDSGGPVFDMKGRVIGLHSRIDMSLDANFEVPIDLYRIYWNALTKTENYASLPIQGPLSIDPQTGELKILPGIEQLNVGLKKRLNDRMSRTIFKIKSPYKSKGIQATVLGTLIDMNLKDKSFLVSKSAMVGSVAKVELGPGNTVPAKVVSRDIANDLVLLQIDQKLKGGVNLNAMADTILFADLGKLLTSPQPEGGSLMSVIGNVLIDIPKAPSIAYIGLTAKSVEGKMVITSLAMGGPASSSSLCVGDELLSVNGKTIINEEDLNNEIDSYITNDTAILKLSRAGVAFEKRVPVKIRPQSEMHMAAKFADGRSVRFSGFEKVIIHDGRLKPVECGGPLYGVDGEFYGINIARFSRTSSLAIAAPVVRKFIEDSLAK
ncbi:trypsin-like peptidase domain-containing protein [Pedobacter africanus]|uniref:Serine protease Do n=1 Tax=Pedobacter africanus TaxID=151894 RepID=A0A1W2E7I0_9SPHI|nr:trypsin-like peptidase domain-containing protein [Pedobacter africanus]SMD05392.1 serine protease Do [Pedobacter africanus]